MTTKMARALPPTRRVRSLADSPMVLKNTSSRTSRICRSKVISNPPALRMIATTALQIRPPVTAGGM